MHRLPGVYSLWLLLRPAADVPGQWLAHCLELDVVTQGNSLQHAIEMAIEAVKMAIEADLEADINPFSHPAPKEYFDLLDQVVTKGTPFVGVQELSPSSDVSLVAAQLRIEIGTEERGEARVPTEPILPFSFAASGHDLQPAHA